MSSGRVIVRRQRTAAAVAPIETTKSVAGAAELGTLTRPSRRFAGSDELGSRGRRHEQAGYGGGDLVR